MQIAFLYNISLDVANRIYVWGWGLSVIGAVVTMIGVGLLWTGTRVRDQDFDRQMTRLNSEAASARERAASLKHRSAILENETSKSQLALEQERNERLKLEERQKWRRISPEIAQKIVSQLLTGAKGKVSVVANGFDTEARTFAKQIENILQQSGFELVPYPGTEYPMSWGASGTHIHVRDITHASSTAVNIQKSFERQGYSFESFSSPKHAPHAEDIVIAVGQKE